MDYIHSFWLIVPSGTFYIMIFKAGKELVPGRTIGTGLFLRVNRLTSPPNRINHAGFGHFVFFTEPLLFFVDKDTMLR